MLFQLPLVSEYLKSLHQYLTFLPVYSEKANRRSHLLAIVPSNKIKNFANSLEPDHARHNVGPDLNSNFLTLMVFLKDFFQKS